MSRIPTRFAAALGLFVSSPAWAFYIWFGNPPNVVLQVDRSTHDITSATGTLSAIRMHACGGGYTDYTVGQSVDLADPLTVTVGAGAWCGVSALWGSDVTISNGSWTVSYGEAHTTAEIDENPEDTSVAMTPFEVVSGSFSGTAPRLVVEVAE